jgi:tripartite-type tricarboxylate transporter receptor subunit TctC
MRTGRYVLAFVLGLFASTLLAENASAQNYPTKPITLIAPWAAGGAIDALCRAIGPKLTERLGQPVIIENRPGAGSTLGVAAAGRATPDGYTVVMAGSGSLAISATLSLTMPVGNYLNPYYTFHQIAEFRAQARSTRSLRPMPSCAAPHSAPVPDQVQLGSCVERTPSRLLI